MVTLGNWARPRDLAHFEQFRHYHETFYAQVEALSVTPFSATSLDRGLDGVLVSAARVLTSVVPDGLSPERSAGRIESQRDFVLNVIDGLVRRTRRAADEDAAGRARQRLLNRLDQWTARRKHLADLHKTLVYERVTDDAKYDALMMSAENARARGGGARCPAVRGRELHARGAAGDQPAGQPDQGQPGVHRAARRAAVGVPAG